MKTKLFLKKTIIILFLSLPLFSQEEQVLSSLEDKLELIKLVNETKLFLKSKRHNDAKKNIQKIYQLDPSSNEYYYLKGALDYCQKNNLASKKNLLRSIKLNPNHDLSHFLLGIVYSLEHNWKKAYTHFYQASLLANYDPFYRMNLAIASYNIKDYKQAIYESKKAIEYKQNYKDANILLAYSYLKYDKPREALKVIESLGKLSSNSVIFLDYLTILHDTSKKYHKIISLIGRSNLRNHTKLRILASSYFHVGEHSKSIQTYKKLIQSKMVHQDDYLNYAKVLVFSNNKSLANKTLQLALENGNANKKEIIDKYETIQKEKDIYSMLYHPYPR